MICDDERRFFSYVGKTRCNKLIFPMAKKITLFFTFKIGRDGWIHDKAKAQT